MSTQPQPATEPITNQEILAAGQRIANDLIAHLLTEARDYLGTDTIGEAIGDDPDHHRLDAHTRGLVWREVWDRLGRGATDAERLREQAETAHVRLWLIEQTLRRVDASQDPAGIAGHVGPYFDGPLHPDHIAAYHAAQEA
ncbi:hypothetical protein AB0O91_21160 [Kitasatospora sp. NPDC089797]|uniref:hypothetical protein n=1 Tax=Kitasatospora sp. NPDC089797 TaxID=3155298 RepID=UPI00342FEAD0